MKSSIAQEPEVNERIPVTSPDNIIETRQRLSKLISRDRGHGDLKKSNAISDFDQSDAVKSLSKSKAVASAKFYDQTVARSRSPALRRTSDDNKPVGVKPSTSSRRTEVGGAHTPTATDRFEKTNVFNRSIISNEVNYRKRNDVHYQESITSSSSVSGTNIDLDRLNACVASWNKTALRSIGTAVSVLDIVLRIQRIHQYLSSLYIGDIQLWVRHCSDSLSDLCDPTHPMQERLWSRSVENSQWNQIPDNVGNYIFNYYERESEGHEFHLKIYPSDSIWSSLAGSVVTYNDSPTQGLTRNPHLFWHCIHIIALPAFKRSLDNASDSDDGLPFGYLVFTEVMDNSSTAQQSLLLQSQQSPLTSMKVLLGSECVEHLSAAISMRLAELCSRTVAVNTFEKASTVNTSQIRALEFSKYSLDILVAPNIETVLQSCAQAMCAITTAQSCICCFVDQSGSFVALSTSAVRGKDHDADNNCYINVSHYSRSSMNAKDSLSFSSVISPINRQNSAKLNELLAENRNNLNAFEVSDRYLGLAVRYVSEEVFAEFGISFATHGDINDSLDNSYERSQRGLCVVDIHSTEFTWDLHSQETVATDSCKLKFNMMLVIDEHDVNRQESDVAINQQAVKWVNLMRIHTISKLSDFIRLENISWNNEICQIQQRFMASQSLRSAVAYNNQTCSEVRARQQLMDDVCSIISEFKSESELLRKVLGWNSMSLVVSDRLIDSDQSKISADGMDTIKLYVMKNSFEDADFPSLLNSVSISTASPSRSSSVMRSSKPMWLAELDKGTALYIPSQATTAVQSQAKTALLSKHEGLQRLIDSIFGDISIKSVVLHPIGFNAKQECICFVVGVNKRCRGISPSLLTGLPVNCSLLSSFDTRVFQQSNVATTVNNFLQSALQRYQLVSSQQAIDKGLSNLDSIATITCQQQHRRLLGNVFSKWYVQYLSAMEAKRLRSRQYVIDSIREALELNKQTWERLGPQFHQLFNAKYVTINNDLLKRYQELQSSLKESRNEIFLKILESHFTALFPKDVVIVSKDEVKSYRLPAEANRGVLVEDIIVSNYSLPLFDNAMVAQSEEELVVVEVASLSEHINLAPAVVGCVKIVRTKTTETMSNSTAQKFFQDSEIGMVREIISLISAAYSSLSVASLPFSPPFSLCDKLQPEIDYEAMEVAKEKEDAFKNLLSIQDNQISQIESDKLLLQDENRVLLRTVSQLSDQLLPAMARIVPLVLSSTLQESVSSLLADFPMIAKLMKSVIDSDVVLMKLFCGSSTGLQVDAVISSEDIISRSGASLKGAAASSGIVKSSLTDLVNPILSAEVGQRQNDDDSECGSSDSLVDQLYFQLSSAWPSNQANLLAEIRLIGASQLSHDQSHLLAIQIISYIVAHSLSVARRIELLKQENGDNNLSISKLEESVRSTTVDLQRERMSVSAYKTRLAVALQFIVFLAKSSDVISISQLGVIISQALPAVFQATRVALLVLQSGATESAMQSFYECLDEDFPIGEGSSPKIVSSAYLQSLPSFPSWAHADNIPSKLFISRESNPPSSTPQHCLLILNKHQMQIDPGTGMATAVEQPWKGLEEIVTSSIAACIANCATKAEIAHSINIIKGKLHEAEAVQVERSRLGEEVFRLNNQLERTTEANTSLLRDMESLKHVLQRTESDLNEVRSSSHKEITELQKQKEEIERDAIRQFDALNGKVASVEESKRALLDSKTNILELISSFSSDRRVHGGRVMDWLKDYVDVVNAQLEFVVQEADGKLVGNGKIESIRGVLAAAGEAIRTGHAVSFSSSFVATSNLFREGSEHSSSSKVFRFSRDSQSTFDMERRDEKSKIFVYCVPNMGLVPGKHNKHACAVFVKIENALESNLEGFTSSDSEMLKCAMNLAFTALAKESNELTLDQFQKLEDEIASGRTKMERIREAIVLCEQSWSKGITNPVELATNVEAGAISLLSRGKGDNCAVEAFFWCPQWAASIKGGMSILSAMSKKACGNSIIDNEESVACVLSTKALASEIDIVTRILTTGKTYRNLGIIWCPVKTPHGDIGALLRLERKLSLSKSEAVFGLTSHKRGGLADESQHLSHYAIPTIEDVIVSEEDEEVLGLYCRMSYPLLDRLSCTHDAISTVRQAAKAIEVLESSQTALQDRMAQEIEHRVQMEEAIKAGTSLLQLASGHRVSSMQIMEAARSAIISSTASDECYVMFPEVFHQIVAGNEAASSTKSFSRKASISSRRTNINSSSGSDEEIGNSSIADSKAFYSFEPNRRNSIKARFQLGDLEVMCLQESNVVTSPVTIAGDGVSTSSPSVATCASWTARRVLSLKSIDGLETAKDLVVLAVPWVLPWQYCDYSTTCSSKHDESKAVITVVRQTLPFNQAERDVIVWLGKVMSHCLAVACAEQTAQNWQKSIVEMQDEVRRLSSLYGINSNIEASLDGFVDILSRSRESSSHVDETMEDRILHAAEFVFGHKNVDLLFATRPNIPLGSTQLIPPIRERNGRQHSAHGSNCKAMAVTSAFGNVEAWIDGAEEEDDTDDSDDSNHINDAKLVSNAVDKKRTNLSLRNSLAASIAKLQFQYQIASMSSATPSPVLDQHEQRARHPSAPASAQDLLTKSFNLEFEEAGVMALVKYNDNQQCVLIRIKVDDSNGQSSLNQFGLDRVWKVRLLLLLRLIDTDVPWISKLVSKNNEISLLEEKVKELSQQLTIEASNRQREIHSISSTNIENSNITKEKYKAILKERSKLYTFGEIFLLSGYVAASKFAYQLTSYVREEKFSKCGLLYFKQAIVRALENMCFSMTTSVNNTLWLGLHSDGEGSASHVLEWRGELSWMFVDHKCIHRHDAKGHLLHPHSDFANPLASSPSVEVAVATDAGSAAHTSIESVIAIAIQSGSIVVVSASPDDGTIQRAEEYCKKLFNQAGHNALTASMASANPDASPLRDVVVTITPACGCPIGTMFVPISFPSLGIHAIIIASALTPSAISGGSNSQQTTEGTSVPSDDNPKFSKQSSSMIATQLTTWSMLLQQLHCTVHEATLSRSAKWAQLPFALASLTAIQRKATPTKDSVAKAFFKLKINSIKNYVIKCKFSKRKIGKLESNVSHLQQLLADWTELVKCINNLGSAASEGRSALWARCCRTLMSLLSSHVTVKSCGLVLQVATVHRKAQLSAIASSVSDEYSIDDSTNNHNNGSQRAEEIVELAVRDVSTPFHGARKKKHESLEEDMPDFARGLLEYRSLEDYGHQVMSIVNDLLASAEQPSDANSADYSVHHSLQQHRIIKLKKHHHHHHNHHNEYHLDHFTSGRGRESSKRSRPPASATASASASGSASGSGGGGLQLDTSADNEEIWLVPIKTTSKTVGVLRLSVSIDALRTDEMRSSTGPHTPSSASNTLHNRRSRNNNNNSSSSRGRRRTLSHGSSEGSDNDYIAMDGEDSDKIDEQQPRDAVADAREVKDIIDITQDIVIHFADMFAPLLRGAAAVEEMKDSSAYAQAVTKQRELIASETQKENMRIFNCAELLSKAIHSVARVSGQFIIANDVDDVDDGEDRNELGMKDLSLISKMLSRSMSSALQSEVAIVLADATDEQPMENDVLEGAIYHKNRYETDLVTSKGTYVGKLIVHGGSQLIAFLCGGHGNRRHHDHRQVQPRGEVKPGTVLFEEDSVQEQDGLPTAVAEQVGADVQRTASALSQSLLTPMCSLVADTIASHQIESNSRKRVALAAKTLQALETALEEKRSECTELQAAENLLQRSSEFYRQLADVVNQSLQYVANNHSRCHSNTEAMLLSSGIGTYLQELCVKLPSLLGEQCFVTFAVVNDPFSDAMQAQQQQQQQQQQRSHLLSGMLLDGLDWYTATTSGGPAGHAPSVLLDLDAATRTVVMNMARNVIATGQTASIEISSTMGITANATMAAMSSLLPEQAPLSSSPSLKIFTWPIRATSRVGKCIGAMQLLVPADSSANLMDVDGFCQDIAAVAGCVVTVTEEWSKLNKAANTIEQEIVLVESTKDVEANEMNRIKQKLTHLEILTQLLNELSHRSSALSVAASESSGKDASNSNSSATARELLTSWAQSATIRELLAKVGLAFANQESFDIAESSTAPRVLDPIFVPLSSADAGPVPGSGQLDEGLLYETMRMLNVSAQSYLAMQLRHDKKQSDNSQKLSSAGRKVERLKAEVVEYQSKLSEELQKREKLIGQLADMHQQLPTIYDEAASTVSSLLHTLGEALTPFATEHGDIVSTGSASAAGVVVGSSANPGDAGEEILLKRVLHKSYRLLQRITTNSFPFHLSIISDADTEKSKDSDQETKAIDLRLLSVSCTGKKGSGVTDFHLTDVAAGESVAVTLPLQGSSNLRRRQSTSSSSSSNRNTDWESVGMSGLEKCLLKACAVEEAVVSNPSSLIGLAKSELFSLFGRLSDQAGQQVNQLLPPLSAIYVPITTSSTGRRAVFRLLFPPLDQEPLDSKQQSSAADNLQFMVLAAGAMQSSLQLMAIVANLAFKNIRRTEEKTETEFAAREVFSKQSEEVADIKEQLQRAHRLCRVVSREASILLDSPVVTMTSNSSSSSMPSHPASLPPVLASQDIALKMLSMVRTLLRSEGQALLLKDLTTDPASYQVIQTGSSLTWPGIESGLFGTVNLPFDLDRGIQSKSLVEAVMKSHKPIQVADVHRDTRYAPSLDGHCSVATPMAIVPVRGRGGAVVGVVVAVKGQGQKAFSNEDMVALEVTAAFGSLSLYWCQGLGILHNKLLRTSSKMNQIESAVDELRKAK